MTAEVTSRGKLFHIYSRCSDAENEILFTVFYFAPENCAAVRRGPVSCSGGRRPQVLGECH